MSEDAPTPEELTRAFHSPAAKEGPEAKRRCAICGIPEGDFLGLSQGLCNTCWRKSRDIERKAEEKIARKKRKDYFKREEPEKCDEAREGSPDGYLRQQFSVPYPPLNYPVPFPGRISNGISGLREPSFVQGIVFGFFAGSLAGYAIGEYLASRKIK